MGGGAIQMGDLSNEPSMEDILASIKKIIADDSDRKLAPPRRAGAREINLDEYDSRPQAEPDVQDDDVLDLTESRIAPEPVQPEPVRAAPAPAGEPDILSQAAVEASRSALSSLSRLVVKPEEPGNNTLEGLVRDMLKPMLKDWLDAHLPEVVERVVAKEVARISGRTL